MTTGQLLSVAPNLVVDDIVASAEFYRDKLGFYFDRSTLWNDQLDPDCKRIVYILAFYLQ
jgi:hypothetical protein